MFDGRWRVGVDRVVVPIGRVLWRLGVRADHVTLFGVAASGGAPRLGGVEPGGGGV